MATPVFGSIEIRSQSLLKFFEAAANGTNSVAVRAPATLAADFTITLPSAQAANDDVMTADSSGNLSFAKIDNANIASGAAIDAAKIADGSVSSTEFQYLANVTSDIQTQIDSKVAKAGDTMTGSLLMDNQSQMRLGELDANGTSYVAMQAPAALAASYTLTMPADAGTSGYVLSTDGAGELSWIPNSASVSFAADWATGDGTTKAITHSLGTKDVMVQVYDKSNDQTIYVDSVVRTDTNTVTLTASEAPNASSWRVVIIAA